jgi:hypothetical protein
MNYQNYRIEECVRSKLAAFKKKMKTILQCRRYFELLPVLQGEADNELNDLPISQLGDLSVIHELPELQN